MEKEYHQKADFDIAVIGGGPAGLAAAIQGRLAGARRILILERDRDLGGILLQCIHNGFGLHYFGEELTGPEYAGRFSDRIRELGIEYRTDTMVLELTPDKRIWAMNTVEGLMEISARAVILAMGCRERTRGALNIPGTRPAGIFTAGAAQRFVNIEGYMPGRKIVILGSGDIGLIMARRLTLEGAEVKLVCEIMPYSGGLNRNIVQCIEDFDIPLRFNHTLTRIHGKARVEGVTVSRVDENRKPIPGTEEFVQCDTVLLSVGLLPENEISKGCGIVMDGMTGGPMVNEAMETSVPGIFACGNVVHVHDLVDFVTEESERAGKNAALFVNKLHGPNHSRTVIRPGNRVRYTVPQSIDYKSESGDITVFFRSTDVYRNVNVAVYSDGEKILNTRKPIVTPGEMQTVKIKKELVGNLRGNLTIAVEIPEEDVD